MTGPTWLRWLPIGRLVHDCNVGRTRVGVRSLAAASGRRPAEAARPAGEASLHRPADTLARLGGDATEILAELHAAPQPTPSVDQPVDNDDQAGAS